MVKAAAPFAEQGGTFGGWEEAAAAPAVPDDWSKKLGAAADLTYAQQIAAIQYGSPLNEALTNLRTEGTQLSEMNLIDMLLFSSTVDMITQKQKVVVYSTNLRNFNCVHFPCKYDGNCELIPLIDFSDELKESLRGQVFNEISMAMRLSDFQSFFNSLSGTVVADPAAIENVVNDYIWATSVNSNNVRLSGQGYTMSLWINDGWMPVIELDWSPNAWKLINFIELFIAQKIIAMSLSDLARYESVETVAAMYDLVGKSIRCSCALGFGGTHCEFCVLTDDSIIADNEFEYHGIKPIGARVG
ncbi:uncharacterized protein LOC120341482 [Styela clava]